VERVKKAFFVNKVSVLRIIAGWSDVELVKAALWFEAG
jgi:hypothetical protein